MLWRYETPPHGLTPALLSFECKMNIIVQQEVLQWVPWKVKHDGE